MPSPLRIIFMGTPPFALPALRALCDDPQRFTVCLVISRPDAPSGRGLRLNPSAISQEAMVRNLPLLQPTSLHGPEGLAVEQQIQALNADFIVEVAFGLLIPDSIIRTPRYGSINAHASLLPRWRGAAPLERAILAGDRQTGVTIQGVSAELDAGPIFASETVEMAQKTVPELAAEMSAIGASLLVDCLPRIAAGQLQPYEQDSDAITYAEKVHKDELYLSPELSAAANLRRVRASGQHAAARCQLAGRGVRVLAAQSLAASTNGTPVLLPGQAAYIDKHLLLMAADAAFEVLQLAPDGKKAMSAAQFSCGVPALVSCECAGAATLPAQPATWTTWS